MTLVYPEIDHVFDTETALVNTVVIENQTLFFSLLQDIVMQLQGLDGKIVLSDKQKILKIDKNVELLDRFIPFELNQKSIQNKLYSMIEHLLEEDVYYHDTVQIKAEIEAYLNRLSLNFPYEIDFQSINVNALLKASNVRLSEEYPNLSEKILDYIGIVRELDRNKLFITVNLRSFISDEEAEALCKEFIVRRYDIIMLESTARKRLSTEKRYIIDSSLCEIS